METSFNSPHNVELCSQIICLVRIIKSHASSATVFFKNEKIQK